MNDRRPMRPISTIVACTALRALESRLRRLVYNVFFKGAHYQLPPWDAFVRSMCSQCSCREFMLQIRFLRASCYQPQQPFRRI